ncbi:uncharacterized protein [Diabrotica undecimpunctata]|uniref:uncharacterized protein n=1 Tax=Diabrotica undecimpunctata TaxID=50387 RepID=UPI003B63A60D
MEPNKKLSEKSKTSTNSEAESETQVSKEETAPNLNGDDTEIDKETSIDEPVNDDKEATAIEEEAVVTEKQGEKEEHKEAEPKPKKAEGPKNAEKEPEESEKEILENESEMEEEPKENPVKEKVSQKTESMDTEEKENVAEPVNKVADDKTIISTENNKNITEEAKETANNGKDVVKNVKNVPERIENPKEKVPKGRKRKISEMVNTENENKTETTKILPTQKESKSEPNFEPLVLVKEEPVDMDLYPTSVAEPLGKGKRARIPNKRYSDILMSPTSIKKSVSNTTENGSLESGNDTDTSIKEEPWVSPSYSGNSSPVVKRVKISHTDLSDPKYLKPFKYGWKRELVWRGTYDQSKGRQGDIYYYTPLGKKVRSTREVAEVLNNKELSLENFSFFKEPIGLNDTSKEIIRDAKVKQTEPLSKQVFNKSLKSTPIQMTKSPKLSNSKLSSPKLTNKKLTSPKISSPKLTNNKITSPKMATPKMATPKLVSPKNRSPKMTSPKIASPKIASPKITSPKLQKTKVASPKLGSSRIALSRMKSSRAASPKPVVNEVTENSSTKTSKIVVKKEMKKTPEKPAKKKEIEEPSPIVTVAKRSRRESAEGDGNQSEECSEVGPDKPCQPCSIRCKPGTIPTLQCRVCLCLYHHECVGIAPHISLPYICKNCHQDQTSDQSPVLMSGTISSPTILSPLPPLTPINTLKSSGGQPITLPPPKLQRIPKPTDSEISSHLPSAPKLKTEQKSLVGSMTTWLPHNAKLIENIRQVNETPSGQGIHRPQYVEILGGRKFLVIPKHNFMSVSPTVATSAVTSRPNVDPINIDSASLGSDPVSDIKTEPESPSKPENSQTPEAMEVEDIVEENIGADSAAGDGGTGIQQDIKPEVATPKAPTPPPTIVKTKKRSIKLTSITSSEEKEEKKFMENYLQNISYGYNTLLYIFQYLKVQDLLRAGCVCTMWRDIASHPILWRTVRMKNSQVHSFEGLAHSLKKHGTRHLDLRKMLLPTGGDEIWPAFSEAIEKVETLRRIELCRCPASVVEKLATSNPQLEIINAVTIKCETMNLEPLKALTEIKELRLKATGGLTLTSNIDSLKDMKELRHLSLTSIRHLNEMNLKVVAELVNLESLDLGECTNFPENFGREILIKLTKLEKLRLEKGQKDCHTFEILEAVRRMEHLDQLELVNFDIKAGFDKALGVCQNIKKLLIIPTYISQSATTNHMVLGGVLRLQNTLSHFVWGVTLELLRVTELFVDQCEDPKEKKEKKQVGNGDCIPVLKPVPLLLDKDSEIAPALEPPQVEILALPSLQKLLMQNLPTTRVKILKIPFHATWRQSITDSVN